MAEKKGAYPQHSKIAQIIHHSREVTLAFHSIGTVIPLQAEVIPHDKMTRTGQNINTTEPTKTTYLNTQTITKLNIDK